MRILAVRCFNLNSLRGVTEIDFRDEAFSGGLFAITGPTGAGKSTILDAICLALFHRTPRLGPLSAAENELMSQHTGECWAEVEFETNGESYRARWGQKRAHSKPNGRLQPTQVELAKSDGTVLTSSISEKKLLVEQYTGLSYEQFTRSVLLAQGAFNQFLEASEKDRAALLEQLTGTEIYARISALVFQRTSAARTKMELIQARAGGVEILQEEELAQLQQAHADAMAVAADLAPKLNSAKEHIQWLDSVSGAASDVAAAQDAKNQQPVHRRQMNWTLPPAKLCTFANQTGRAPPAKLCNDPVIICSGVTLSVETTRVWCAATAFAKSSSHRIAHSRTAWSSGSSARSRNSAHTGTASKPCNMPVVSLATGSSSTTTGAHTRRWA